MLLLKEFYSIRTQDWQCPFRSIGILNYFSKLVFELESFVSLLELKQIRVLWPASDVTHTEAKILLQSQLIPYCFTADHHVMMEFPVITASWLLIVKFP